MCASHIHITSIGHNHSSCSYTGHTGTLDFVYIDADKKNYDHYYEKALLLLRPGGIIAVDNAFQGGRVLNPSDHSGDTVWYGKVAYDRRADAETVHALNQKIMKDERVMGSLLKIADGVNLCLKL